MVFSGCDGDLCSLFQTQAAQTVLQSREGPAMPRMALLMGLMGIGMSGYSSRQLTLHYKPARQPPWIPPGRTSLNFFFAVNLLCTMICNGENSWWQVTRQVQ
uniref:Uncharacterized protein n=1 Tax=Seriola lalandi dorsalis TaxID=1841481 RepID=A0A3B4WRN1_SERLL